MGELGDFWRDVKEHRRQVRDKHGIDCPGCKVLYPKRWPTRLLPGQGCRVCGYRRPPRKLKRKRDPRSISQ